MQAQDQQEPIRHQRKRLGDILLSMGAITEDQLQQVLDLPRDSHLRLGQQLVQMGLVTERQIVQALSQQLDIPSLSDDDFMIDPEVVGTIPSTLVQRHKAVPIFLLGERLTVAIADPRNLRAIDDLKRSTKHRINLVVAPERAIQKAIEQYYRADDSLDRFVSTLPESGESEESTIIDLVDVIISQAVYRRASDIHIEPSRSVSRIRFRIDGTLRWMTTLPVIYQPAIVSRIKVMGTMDIAEKRVPQDGRALLEVGSHHLDLRISTMPSVHGEKVVIRILDRSSALFDLASLGFSNQDQDTFAEMISQPHGMLLLCGPTGSGKTSTLYAALSTINTIDLNIVTIEDPVEYHLDLLTQVQINPKADMTFPSVLRSMLRQDPDVIMIGEIRDAETAHIAVQAALTGHFVFSTLHTNEATGAVNRLIDMGVEPYLIASALAGTVGQRLVRKICTRCKQPADVPHSLIKAVFGQTSEPIQLYEGKGCFSCQKSGYSGRTAIAEVFVCNEEAQALILERAPTGQLTRIACKHGMTTLRDDGLKKAKEGATTIEEVLRVTADYRQDD